MKQIIQWIIAVVSLEYLLLQWHYGKEKIKYLDTIITISCHTHFLTDIIIVIVTQQYIFKERTSLDINVTIVVLVHILLHIVILVHILVHIVLLMHRYFLSPYRVRPHPQFQLDMWVVFSHPIVQEWWHWWCFWWQWQLCLREKFIAKNRQVDDASVEGRLIYFKQLWWF